MKLYSYYRSSSAWRVRIGLNLKGVAHELVPVHLLRGGGEQHRPEFRALSPLGHVPVLEIPAPDGPFFLTQSVAILEYLEEAYPAPPLLPASSELRARTREFVELVNSGIQPLQNLRQQQQLRAHGVDPAPLVRASIEAGLTALERYVETSEGRFAMGDAVTLADLFLVPQLYASRSVGVDAARFPSLCRVEAECARLPAFAAARPERQPDFEPPNPS